LPAGHRKTIWSKFDFVIRGKYLRRAMADGNCTGSAKSACYEEKLRKALKTGKFKLRTGALLDRRVATLQSFGVRNM
jgi:hypothetical protein